MAASSNRPIGENQTIDVIRARRATRNFSSREVSQDLIIELIDLANRSPSGFNLQPWHFVVVQDPSLRRLLAHVAMDQRQVLEAPVTVAFVADPWAWKSSYPEIVRRALAEGRLAERQATMYRKNVKLMFRLGPLGLFGLAKRIALPIRRLRHPTPHVVTTETEAICYVRAQTMLAASTFMVGAQALGLRTSPMEGFDEYRLKRLLMIPAHMTVPIIIAVGYSLDDEDTPLSFRCSLDEKLSFDRFGSRR